MDEINYLMCDDLADFDDGGWLSDFSWIPYLSETRGPVPGSPLTITHGEPNGGWSSDDLDQIADGLAGEDTRDQGDYATPVTYVHDPLACGLTMAEIMTRLGCADVAEIEEIEAQRKARFGVSAAEAQGTVEL